MSRQPLAASRRAASQSSRRSPSRVEVTAVTSAADEHERQVADRRDGVVVLRRVHPHRLGARRPGQPLDALHVFADGPANPAR